MEKESMNNVNIYGVLDSKYGNCATVLCRFNAFTHLNCSNYNRILIISENSNFKYFDFFEEEGSVFEVLGIPLDYLENITDYNEDYLIEKDIIDGFVIRDEYGFIKHLRNKLLAKDLLNTKKKEPSFYQEQFSITRLLKIISFSKNNAALSNSAYLELLFEMMILKGKRNGTLKNIDFYIKNIKKSIDNDMINIYNKCLIDNDFTQLIDIANNMLNEIGGELNIFSTSDKLPFVKSNSIVFFFKVDIPLEGFIKKFLNPLLDVLKSYLSDALFYFEYISFDSGGKENGYAVNLFLDKHRINNTLIPNIAFASKTLKYEFLLKNISFPYNKRKESIILIKDQTNSIKQSYSCLSMELLKIYFEDNSITLSKILSYSFYIYLTITHYAKLSKTDFIKLNDYLYDRWLIKAIDEKEFGSLKDIDHRILSLKNEFDDIYQKQNISLHKNFRQQLVNWSSPEDNNISITLKPFVLFFDSHGSMVEKNEISLILSQYFKNEDQSKINLFYLLENCLNDLFGILSIQSYYRSYVFYAIKRMIHEI